MPYELSANSGPADVWVRGDFPQSLELPDDVSVYDVVAAGDATSYGFVPRFVAANQGTRMGDLIWTTGATKIASRRFLETLSEIDATGYKTFPVELVTGAGGEGYEGVTVTGRSSDDLFNPDGIHWFSFTASDRLVIALQRRGAVELSMKRTADS